MLSRALAPGVWQSACLLAPAFLLAQCALWQDADATGTTTASIVYGTEVASPNSPVLFVNGPEGLCTAILIGTKLVVTARHCVAALTQGSFTCSASGELEPGSSGGFLGVDNTPSSIGFFSAAHAASGAGSGAPDAVGAQILSTGSPTACRDDIAFVILSQSIAGIAPVPVRLNPITAIGESVSLWGYGLTDEAAARIALRVHERVEIVAIGPDVATSLPQAAPVRAVRVGPGTVSCNGDSGGPILSATTGAVIALISLGVQADVGPYCAYSSDSNTTGPRLAEYRDLALAAFNAAGDSPVPEPSSIDAAAYSDAPPDPDAQPELVDATDVGMPSDGAADGGTDIADSATRRLRTNGVGAGCSTGPPTGADGHAVVALIALAVGSATRKRRSR